MIRPSMASQSLSARLFIAVLSSPRKRECEQMLYSIREKRF